jgi:ketosteroid isomerase-like protein
MRSGQKVPQSDKSKFLPEEANRNVRQLLAEILFSRNQPKKFIEYFHADAIWHVIGRIRDYSFSGQYRGHQEILALMHRIDGEVVLSDHKILNIVVEGDNIALRRSASVRHHGTAATDKLLIGNFARFRDGKIAEAYEYLDTCWLKRLSGEVD